MTLLVLLSLLPLMTLANEGHTDEEEHVAGEVVGGLSPTVGLIGVALAVGVGFAVWVFMKNQSGTRNVPPPKDEQAQNPKDKDSE